MLGERCDSNEADVYRLLFAATITILAMEFWRLGGDSVKPGTVNAIELRA